MANNATEAKGFYKLSWMQRIGFGAGDMAQNLIYQTISIWLLFFYTNVYGLNPAAAATMFLVSSLSTLQSGQRLGNSRMFSNFAPRHV